MKNLTLVASAAVLLCQNSFALSLSPPLAVSSTGTIPKGVSNPKLLNVSYSYDTKLNSQGQPEPLAQPLNKTVKFKDVIMVQSSDTDKQQISALLKMMGYSESDSPGSTNGQINASVSTWNPQFAYGISDEITLQAALPIVHTDVSASTGFVGTAQGQAFINKLCTMVSPVVCEQKRAQFTNAVGLMTSYYGYEPVKSKTEDHVGDLGIGAKYKFFDDGNNSASITASLTLPTGYESSIDELIDTSTGDGNYKIGGTFAVARKSILGNLGGSAYIGYTNQLADTKMMRVPKDTDLLPRDKETVGRDLGERYAYGLGPSYLIEPIHLTLNTGYHFQYLAKSSYTGNLYTKDRYAKMSENTDSLLHSMSAGLNFSTVSMYRGGKFAAPLEANLLYSRVLSGRNVSKQERVGAELVFYF